MTNTIDTLTLLIVSYPGALKSSIYGLSELFEYANRCAQQLQLSARFDCQLLDEAELPSTNTQANTVVILPPSHTDEYYLNPREELLSWLQLQHQQGCQISSACAGSFILAASGLLDGRRATTHWGLAEPFRQRFAQVSLAIDQLLVEDGEILTAGGLMSWTDLGLALVQRHAGSEAMRQLGKYLIVDTAPREQRYYQRFEPPMQHPDKQVLKAQKYLHSHLDKSLTILQLAELTSLGERTFIRRFNRATGYPPHQYLLRLRIQRGCDLLESSNQSVEAIAYAVGYEDASAFRKAFNKIIGLTPKAFRQRFVASQPNQS